MGSMADSALDLVAISPYAASFTQAEDGPLVRLYTFKQDPDITHEIPLLDETFGIITARVLKDRRTAHADVFFRLTVDGAGPNDGSTVALDLSNLNRRILGVTDPEVEPTIIPNGVPIAITNLGGGGPKFIIPVEALPNPYNGRYGYILEQVSDLVWYHDPLNEDTIQASLSYFVTLND